MLPTHQFLTIYSAKSDWQIFTAAMLQSTSTTVRDQLVSGVYKYASNTVSGNTEPFGDWYETTTGVYNAFRSRPVVGGHLALVSYPGSRVRKLKLRKAQLTLTSGGGSTTPTTTTTTAPATTSTPASTTCSGVAAWVNNIAYVAGDEVTYNGALWVAKWWTYGASRTLLNRRSRLPNIPQVTLQAAPPVRGIRSTLARCHACMDVNLGNICTLSP